MDKLMDILERAFEFLLAYLSEILGLETKEDENADA